MVLAEATRRLASVSDSPRLDAELLLAHAIGISRETLLLRLRDQTVPAEFESLVARRLTHEPVAYIVGHRDFWTIELAVGPDVLIPRPDSETLIEAAVRHFGNKGPRAVLDLGTGSGALLLAALDEWPNATGVGIDASAAAVAVARANADRLGMSGRAEIRQGGWKEASVGRFDLVLCNPPYIGEDEPLPIDVVRFEPASALFAGKDGLDDYRTLASLLRLPPDGIACFEIGSSQAAAVSALFRERYFRTTIKRDLAGRDRCVIVVPET
ncbi:peptide chain release factor N(5)-glutamine methyltransferase [Sphingomonas sp. MMS24-J13]|uniref:peptide chain release factor N(5)-glutamine methyltransferase n=1 Tax=Sphingomonas sp. MMS24-J13 TaxID=3238686 RepID=UPI00384AD74D